MRDDDTSPCEQARRAYRDALQVYINALDAFEAANQKFRVAEAAWERAERERDADPDNRDKQAAYHAATTALVSASDRETRARKALRRAEQALEPLRRRVLRDCDGPQSVVVALGDQALQLTVSCAIPYTRRLHASVSILGYLPTRETQQLTGVTIVDRDGPQGRHGKVIGQWSDGELTVFSGPYLRKHLHSHPIEQIVKHEVGHDVYSHLSGSDRAEWKQFFEAHKADMPTEYGRVDQDEGFSESYMYLRNHKTLKRDVREKLQALLARLPA